MTARAERTFSEQNGMEHIELERHEGFHVVAGSERSQAATMVLAPDTSTGGPENRHPGSDQWLYVMSGNGRAVVGGKKVAVDAGDLLLIEAGETHEIVNDGEDFLVTLNVYTPPVY